MKNAVLWVIKPSSYLSENITPLLQSPSGKCDVRFEVFTAVNMKNAVFWDTKAQVLPHRKHPTSPLQRPAG
jgi:hypothetical protein